METKYLMKLFSLLLIVQLTSSRSVSHSETTFKPNGDKVTRTWSTNESDVADDHPLGPFPALITPESQPVDFSSIYNTDTLVDKKPYKETIRISDSSFDELRKQAAVAKGMDPMAITELLATKQPVIKTTTDVNGQLRTTTYKLEPDGSISSRTIIEFKPEVMVNGRPLSSDFDLTRNAGTNWDWRTPTKPKTKWPPSSSQNWPDLNAVPPEPSQATDVKLPESWNPKLWGTQQKPYFNGYSNPDVEVFTPRKSNPVDWKNGNDLFPEGAEADIDPFGSFGSHPPGTYTKTTTDDNGNTIKTTLTVNKKTLDYPVHRPFADQFPENNWFNSPNTPTTPKTITSWPFSEPSSPPTTTTMKTILAEKPNVFTSTEPDKPLPSLEDFLKSQYGNKTPVSTPTPTQPTRPKSTTIYTPLSSFKPINPTNPTNPTTTTSQKPVATINVDDLPIAEVLRNGKPVNDGEFLSTLPSELRPTLLAPTTIYKVQNIPHTPTLEDFDPTIRERLINAGITNDDLRRMQGDEITKTVRGPDGKITRTTIKVKLVPYTGEPSRFQPKVPSRINPSAHQPEDTGKGLNPVGNSNRRGTNPTNYDETQFPEYPPYDFPVDSWNPKYPTRTEPEIDEGFDWLTPKPMPCVPQIDNVPKNPVDAFLHKLDLKAADLSSKHGEWLKTILDENGRILTVKLTLSDIVDGHKKKGETANPRPLK